MIQYICTTSHVNYTSCFVLLSDKEVHLLELTRPLLSLSSPTRGKYSLLASLVPHIDISLIDTEWAGLPQELMNTMGIQVLACRVSKLEVCKLNNYYYCFTIGW